MLDSDVEFTVNLASSIIKAEFDPTLLNEAITNLIENALQHGGTALSEIVITVTGDNRFVAIIVENNGQRMEEGEIYSCFERFSQIGENPGSGLGLAMVHEIAKIHNGAITVATRPHMKFTFSMPF